METKAEKMKNVNLNNMMRIKQVMAIKGISQVELAKKMKVSRQMIANYNSGAHTKKLLKLADALECTIFELYEAPAGFSHVYHGEKYQGLIKIIND